MEKQFQVDDAPSHSSKFTPYLRIK